MSSRQDPVPDWLVERLAARDLPDVVAASVRARLESTGGLGRVQALEASNVAILAAHPPASVMAEVGRRTAQIGRQADERAGHQNRPRRFVLSGLTLGAVGGLAVLLAVVRPVPEPEDATTSVAAHGREVAGGDTVRLKGLRPRLVIYRRIPTGVSRIDATKPVRAGDTLQVAYVAAGRRYGVVASVDARGAVTLHLPERPGEAARLAAQGETALPHSFELDDSPGFERFVFATADSPFAAARILEALRPGGPPMPSQITTTEVRLKKEPR